MLGVEGGGYSRLDFLAKAIADLAPKPMLDEGVGLRLNAGGAVFGGGHGATAAAVMVACNFIFSFGKIRPSTRETASFAVASSRAFETQERDNSSWTDLKLSL
jgi:hypothetical protein